MKAGIHGGDLLELHQEGEVSFNDIFLKIFRIYDSFIRTRRPTFKFIRVGRGVKNILSFKRISKIFWKKLWAFFNVLVKIKNNFEELYFDIHDGL